VKKRSHLLFVAAGNVSCPAVEAHRKQGNGQAPFSGTAVPEGISNRTTSSLQGVMKSTHTLQICLLIYPGLF